MVAFEVPVLLAAVAVVAGGLYLEHHWRRCGRDRRLRAAHWTGKAIDVTGLKTRVEVVRRDYLVARHSARRMSFHRAFMAVARRTVARLAYFHRKDPEDHAQTQHQ